MTEVSLAQWAALAATVVALAGCGPVTSTDASCLPIQGVGCARAMPLGLALGGEVSREAPSSFEYLEVGSAGRVQFTIDIEATGARPSVRILVYDQEPIPAANPVAMMTGVSHTTTLARVFEAGRIFVRVDLIRGDLAAYEIRTDFEPLAPIPTGRSRPAGDPGPPGG